MGAWGNGPFDNDDATDWSYELEGANDFTPVRSVLARVAEQSAYLEARDGSVAIAAAEVVAAAHAHPTSSLPEEVAEWAVSHAPQLTSEDVARAVAAVDRTLGDDSELRELWTEASDTGWVDAVLDLRHRLTAEPRRTD